ncbi:hypothetical protein MFIFM68171_11199 [Madurella fahalii]|uniref:Luciferase domain-containing protein n=1 Tax=Madurella fahalii TaxID=1157608 RepID=A0ABQ0GTC3_9PEZI
MPVILSIRHDAHPLVFAVSLFLTKSLMDNFTVYQMVWSYALLGLLRWTNSSYGEYKELSLGGPEPTFMDWYAVVALTLFAYVDVTKSPRVRRDEVPYRGRIFSLPVRHGRRPIVKSVAPNRQLDQKGSPAVFHTVENMFQSYQLLHPEHLQIKPSVLERDVSALFHGIGDSGQQWEERVEQWEGEIAHVHVADGSVHVVLHPEDIKTVIEAGWGERHPLCANNKHRFRFYFNIIRKQPLPVPEGLVFIYAPRSEWEIEVLDVIIQSAIWYATRGELYPVTAGTEYPLVRNPAVNWKLKERVSPNQAQCYRCQLLRNHAGLRMLSQCFHAEGGARTRIRQTDIQVPRSLLDTKEQCDLLSSNPWCSGSDSASTSSVGSTTLNNAAEATASNTRGVAIPVFTDEETSSNFSSSSRWYGLSESPEPEADATINAARMVHGRGGLHAHAREAQAGHQRPRNLEEPSGRGEMQEETGDEVWMEQPPSDVSDEWERSFGEEDFF